MDESEAGRIVSEVTIQYSVRELLARIEERQVRQDEKVGQALAQLADRVSSHDARWNRLIGAAIAVSTISGAAAGWIANLIAAR